ncbi:hypothetical protein L3X38_034341 [Prunus dulcis]|uniref:Uncharacterized protein n=1 Tax=Prunus dulcis TaxID=3755 RepID=A0AAD4YWS4_PRUDU|nr:hypothetical protein L3X38_034341 [Prunus dulcis]
MLLPLHCFPPSLPENFEEETWTEVKSAISKIFLKKEAALRSLECLNLIESISEVSWLEMGSSRLYQRIHDECDSHIVAELES